MIPQTAAEIRKDFALFSEAPERHFVLAEEDGTLRGAMAIDWDREEKRGWVLGPFVPEADWPALAGPLFAAGIENLPPEIRQLDTYTDVANRRAIALYTAEGFTVYKRAEVYTAEPPDPLPPAPPAAELPPEQEAAFLALHAEAFPGAPEPGPRILARRSPERPLFALVEDGRFLGYINLRVNEAPREGFVEYLAVAANARGQGHGRKLLEWGLGWCFTGHGLPSLGLLVDTANTGARHLYESVGFTLLHEGLSMRRFSEPAPRSSGSP
jgi:ribosomal protein S18 acetylase RimI-like enzyme